MITANSRITHESSNQCQGLVSVIADLELGCRCAGVVVSNGLEVGGSFAQRRREWRGESEGCKPLLREQTLQLKRGGGGGDSSSYLWGRKERRRGFREGSFKALGTHKIRHFQLHKVR